MTEKHDHDHSMHDHDHDHSMHDHSNEATPDEMDQPDPRDIPDPNRRAVDPMSGVDLDPAVLPSQGSFVGSALDGGGDPDAEAAVAEEFGSDRDAP